MATIEFEIDESFIEDSIIEWLRNEINTDDAVTDYFDEHFPPDEKILEWTRDTVKETQRDEWITRKEFETRLRLASHDLHEKFEEQKKEIQKLRDQIADFAAMKQKKGFLSWLTQPNRSADV